MRTRPRCAAANAVAAPSACAAARNYAGSQFWTPDQVGRIYGVDALIANGMNGQGKTIGLLELAPSRPADTSRFLSCFGLHNKVTVKKIDGGGTPDPIGTLEADIDIQEAAVTAPGARRSFRTKHPTRPPPKPISRMTGARSGSGPNSVFGSTGPASGRRRRGRSVARRSCWPLRRAFPLRRP